MGSPRETGTVQQTTKQIFNPVYMGVDANTHPVASSLSILFSPSDYPNQ